MSLDLNVDSEILERYKRLSTKTGIPLARLVERAMQAPFQGEGDELFLILRSMEGLPSGVGRAGEVSCPYCGKSFQLI